MMGFFSFLGRLLFASFFILSAWQIFSHRRSKRPIEVWQIKVLRSVRKRMPGTWPDFITSLVIYVLLRMIIFHSTFTWKNWIGLVITSAAYAIPYLQLASMAKPTYADDVDLLDGGFDMSTGGICGYLHDLIFITSFVQITSIISGKFWYTYLVIPGFGAYKSFGFIKGFLAPGSEGGEEDEKSRKKREKMEKRATRGKIMKTRNR